ncbi:head fiber protein [Selenomonas sp. AE3005]|uniref:head fiber protein n=1 Tax=Selenomonas sp. AE3005 TaxID=1485543 RepID=UPI00047F5DB7|nr:head fiber protein [Selenomonas sp. AE3005]
MQNYKEINAQDYVSASRTTINDNIKTLMSNNSGTEFPTSNLFEGMKCYRTDLKKTYTLKDVEQQTWEEDGLAEALADAVTIAITGGATGTPTVFDGSGNISIPVTSLDATKLTGTAPIDITGNAATAATANSVAWSGVTGKSNATQSAAGLMSAADKKKLDGIAAGANAYSLPTASSSTLGGVKTGSNITNSSGTISLSKTNVTSALGYTPPTTNTTYSTGTASYSGITKLYTSVGDNTDGTMTQKAIKATVGKGYLTASYYNANTGDWYRVYSDGWVEQGGLRERTASTTYPETGTITYLKPFKSNKHTITIGQNRSSYYDYYPSVFVSKTTTGFSYSDTNYAAPDSYRGFDWMACGMGA